MIDGWKKSAKKRASILRRWYEKRASSCFGSATQSESLDSSTQQVDEFLDCTPGAEVRHRSGRCKTRAQPLPEPRPECYELCNTSSKIGSVHRKYDSFYPPSFKSMTSTTALPYTYSMPPTRVAELPAHQVGPPLPQRELFVANTPDDYDQFRSDLNAFPASKVIVESSSGASRPRPQSYVINSTPIPAGQDGPFPHFGAYPGKPDTDTVPAKIRAYPGGLKRGPAQRPYVPPTLQPTYKNGVPPALRATHDHDKAVLPQGQDKRYSSPASTSKDYSHPMIDFHKEICLNANMSEPNISSRYQSPRIPDIDFPGGFENDFHAEIARRRPQPYVDKEVVRPESRAWMSPSLPLSSSVYEMEATTLAVPIIAHPRIVKARSHTPSRNGAIPQHKRSETLSPVSPLSSNAGTIKFSDFNWPRFSDHQFRIDPAGEYSRRYRDRQREGRREREKCGSRSRSLT